MNTGPLRGPRRHEMACRECCRTDCAGPHGDHHRVVGLEDALMRLIALLRSAGIHEADCALTAYRQNYDRMMMASMMTTAYMMGEPMVDRPACNCILSTQTEIS